MIWRIYDELKYNELVHTKHFRSQDTLVYDAELPCARSKVGRLGGTRVFHYSLVH